MERRRIIKTGEEIPTPKVEVLELPGATVTLEPSANEELKTEAFEEGPSTASPSEVVEEEASVRFRKIGGGTLRLASGRIIKPNQVFSARASEISQSARKFVVPLTGNFQEVDSPKRVEQKYTLHVRAPGWYDILDGEGKVINENALREAQAREMLKSLAG